MPGGAPPVFRNSTLAPFRIRSFRFQWPADLAALWGIEMESVILGWYMLTETGSVELLTLLVSLQALGTLFAPLFGLIGDRIGHRTLLCAMRGFYVLLATTLATLIYADLMSPGPVLVIAALMGSVRPSDIVMRNTLIGATMPAELLMGAIGFSRSTQDIARIAGALAGAGLVALLGIGLAYIGILGCYVLSFVLTLGVASSGGRVRAAPAPERRGGFLAAVGRDLWSAMAYIGNTPYMLATMLLACLVNLTAFPIMNGLLPYVAKEVYFLDQRGLGYMISILAFGSLAGSIFWGRIGSLFRPARLMIVVCPIWHLLLLVFAHIGSPYLGCAVLFMIGATQSSAMVPMSAVLLRTPDPSVRGRVMGVRTLAVYTLPIGMLMAGQLIPQIGFATTVSLYALVGVVATIAIGVAWQHDLWRPDSPANAR